MALRVCRSTDERSAVRIRLVTPLERANNVFWNVVSICSLCDHELLADKVNARALQLYKLDGCHLENAHLEKAHLECAHFEGALLVGADLRGARLGQALLVGADLVGADLRFARFTSTTSAN